MAQRPSCRSCRHCAPLRGAQPICAPLRGAQPIGALLISGVEPIGGPISEAVASGGRPGWCHMRQLTIPPELTGELWCSHWTARPPRLPLTSQTTAAAGAGGPIDQQLSLIGMFDAMGL